MKTQKRKLDHLRVCLQRDVQSGRTNGFERYELLHDALPDMNFDEINIISKFLGKDFDAPIFIEPMTGGTAEAEKINKNLAKAAQDVGIGMGVGSQRAMIENPDLAPTYFVKDIAPDIFLAGNIGASHILELSTEQVAQVVDRIKADALVIHLNTAQEIAQMDGHKKWKGALDAIKKLRSEFKMPVIVKEVGCGITGKAADRLEKTGIDAIDVAGVGGTSWIKVDSLITGKPLSNFFGWGMQTAQCVEQCMEKVKVPVIASGGIRNGIEATKALAMGASLVGLALPLLKPATKSADAVKAVLNHIITEIKISMFLVGAPNLGELKGKVVKI